MYTLTFKQGAIDELKELRPFDRTRIMEELKELQHAPLQAARNRKQLRAEGDLAPVWELRLGDFRVFYEVDEAAGRVVIVLAVRKKGRKTTKEIR